MSEQVVINQIVQLYRQRVDLHKAEKSLTLQIKAKCRMACGGDLKEAGELYKAVSGEGEGVEQLAAAMVPFFNARAVIETSRKATEKELTKLAKKLHVAPFVNETKGFSWLGLASIIGEAGDLSNYATPYRLWKRMGLAVLDGQRQRLVAGADALEHGYCPRRRSVVWNIEAAIIKSASNPPSFWRSVYDKRKAYEQERNEKGGNAEAAERMLKDYRGASKESKSVWEQGKITPAHIDARARRYMGKELLRELWKQWRGSVMEAANDREAA